MRGDRSWKEESRRREKASKRRSLSFNRWLARARALALYLSVRGLVESKAKAAFASADARPSLTQAHTCRRRQLALGGDYAYRAYHGPGSYLQKTANMTWALLWLVVIVSILCCPQAAAATATAAAAASAAARARVSNCRSCCCCCCCCPRQCTYFFGAVFFVMDEEEEYQRHRQIFEKFHF